MGSTPLERQLQQQLDKRCQVSKLRQLKPSPPGSVDFSSNDFLSLSTNPAFRQDFLSSLSCYNLGVGSTGSRLLDGNSHFAEQLERDIAVFHGGESALLTNSGFDANVSIFTCLPQPGDIVVYDELIHASAHDGMRASRAGQRIMFRHNDIDHLLQILQDLKPNIGTKNVFVAVESVYSMEGDLAPLTLICDAIQRTLGQDRVHLIVDEAHATGCYGPHGAGRVSELKLSHRVSIRLHTFGKALACNGAAILCSPTVRSYLINYARPLIFTTFMSFPSLVAIRTAYDWMSLGKVDTLANNLRSLITYLHAELQILQPLITTLPDSSNLIIPTSCPDSPIFALYSTIPRDLAALCQVAGFVVRPVVPPTVPENTERVRVCLHAGNTTQQIDAFVMCLRKWIIEKSATTATDTSSGRADVFTAIQASPPTGKLIAKL